MVDCQWLVSYLSANRFFRELFFNIIFLLIALNMSASHHTLDHQFLQEVSLFQWPKRQDIFSIYPFTSKISWVILHHSLLNLKYIINFCVLWIKFWTSLSLIPGSKPNHWKFKGYETLLKSPQRLTGILTSLTLN